MLETKLFTITHDGVQFGVQATAMNCMTGEDIASQAPWLQTELRAANEILFRAGYAEERQSSYPPGKKYIKLGNVHKGYASYNCSDWLRHNDEPGRTMHEAHKFIIEHWEELRSGEVLDVEKILAGHAARSHT